MRTKVKAPQHTMLTARPHHTNKKYTTFNALLQNLMRVVGLSSFLLGGAAMDSDNLLYPIALLAAGAAIIYITSKGEI